MASCSHTRSPLDDASTFQERHGGKISLALRRLQQQQQQQSIVTKQSPEVHERDSGVEQDRNEEAAYYCDEEVLGSESSGIKWKTLPSLSTEEHFCIQDDNPVGGDAGPSVVDLSALSSGWKISRPGAAFLSGEREEVKTRSGLRSPTFSEASDDSDNAAAVSTEPAHVLSSSSSAAVATQESDLCDAKLQKDVEEEENDDGDYTKQLVSKNKSQRDAIILVNVLQKMTAQFTVHSLATASGIELRRLYDTVRIAASTGFLKKFGEYYHVTPQHEVQIAFAKFYRAMVSIVGSNNKKIRVDVTTPGTGPWIIGAALVKTLHPEVEFESKSIHKKALEYNGVTSAATICLSDLLALAACVTMKRNSLHRQFCYSRHICAAFGLIDFESSSGSRFYWSGKGVFDAKVISAIAFGLTDTEVAEGMAAFCQPVRHGGSVRLGEPTTTTATATTTIIGQLADAAGVAQPITTTTGCPKVARIQDRRATPLIARDTFSKPILLSSAALEHRGVVPVASIPVSTPSFVVTTRHSLSSSAYSRKRSLANISSELGRHAGPQRQQSGHENGGNAGDDSSGNYMPGNDAPGGKHPKQVPLRGTPAYSAFVSAKSAGKFSMDADYALVHIARTVFAGGQWALWKNGTLIRVGDCSSGTPKVAWSSKYIIAEACFLFAGASLLSDHLPLSRFASVDGTVDGNDPHQNMSQHTEHHGSYGQALLPTTATPTTQQVATAVGKERFMYHRAFSPNNVAFAYMSTNLRICNIVARRTNLSLQAIREVAQSSFRTDFTELPFLTSSDI